MLGGLDRRGVGRPAVAAAHDNSSQDSGSGTDVLVTFGSRDVLDGFTYAAGVFTALITGTYRVAWHGVFFQAVGSAGVSFGYRKNGGGTQALALHATANFENFGGEFVIALRAGDTLEFRIIGGASTTGRVYYPNVAATQVSPFWQ